MQVLEPSFELRASLGNWKFRRLIVSTLRSAFSRLVQWGRHVPTHISQSKLELPESLVLQRWTTAGLRIICDDLGSLYAQACSYGLMFAPIPQLAVDEYPLPFIFTQYMMMQDQKPGMI